ncbi:MAG TPA: FAD-linked oxidase C-terminal domain-containing protein [Candidatus Saccharimonadia bacterium]|nr:FAD-linked oxidase C-terminal domain-containing protein [Candidatus Saccharimonadia bacterium]
MLGDAFTTDAADRAAYSYDNSRREALPDAVALPTTHAQAVALVRACHASRTPVVARGRGTNTTGATVPLEGGVVVSFERMNRILALEPDDRLAVVEPGVLNGDLQRALATIGFFWPPDPTSADYATIGGNLGCNAGGPRAVKYGACRENVLGLVAVTGTGETIRTGTRTTKGAVGYDLTRLLVGSEGTLALITEATLKLTPRPLSIATLRALYVDVGAAARAVARIMAQPETPCALEFMDGEAVRLAREIGGADIPEAGALLMIEVDGDPASLDAAVDAVAAAARGEGLVQLGMTSDAAAAAKLWAARKALSPALRTIAPNKINEDVVVPVSRVPELVAGVQAISRESGIAIVNFGHAGTGNIHVNLLYRDDDANAVANAPAALSRVFDLVLSLGGTLSGEHGIGIDKREFMPRAIEPATLALMRAIKSQFDPAGILNPGKLLP